jgi:cell division septation protein DedD
MAGQDFAHIEAPHPDDVRPMGQMKVLLLTIVALGVVAGGFAVGFMVGQDMGIQKATSEDEARLVAQLKKQQQELTKLRTEAKKRVPEASTTQVGELTFYNELPQQSVDPAPMQANSVSTAQDTATVKEMEEIESTPSETLLKQIIEQELKQGADKKAAQVSPIASVKVGEYYLQLASFQKENEAKKFFPKLSKAGYTGTIKQVDLAERGTWYRVYAGPFTSKQASEEAKKDVKGKLNITGLIVKGG